MEVVLCSNASEKNYINKNISVLDTATCVIKGNISYETPVIILAYDSNIADKVNYMRIPELNRSYFITDIINLTGGRYELHGKVDVLESFKSSILGLNVIVDKTETDTLANMYYNDGSFICSEKEFIYTKNFPQGFNNNGEFILITAGGIAAS